MTASTAVVPELDRARLALRAQLLAAATVGYNLVEAVVAVSAGRVAGSSALVGFGLDSVVEVSSGLIILWQFRHHVPESREAQALRLMAFAFFALAAYVTGDAVRTLAGSGAPQASTVGVILAALSLAVMPFLSWAQRRTGRSLGSGSVVADSKQTLLCTYLSAVLLAGLLLNAGLGWWWADPVVGLVIAAVATREGLQAWRGESCGCAPARDLADGTDSAAGAGCGCGPGCTDSCCQPAASVTDAPAGKRSA